jgi:hypothetical protein
MAYFEQTGFDPETDIYTESDLIADRIEEERQRIVEEMSLLPVSFKHEGWKTPGVRDELSFGAGYEKAWADILKIVRDAG